MQAKIISSVLFIALLFLIVTVVFVLINARHQAALEPDFPQISPQTTTVTWLEAVEVLRSGQVDVATQAHDLKVTLVLKNGNVLETTEPVIDEIRREINQCGRACAGITQATE